ncbi:MAG: hypothetical protein R6U00_02810 [Prochlorococcaceae cyanobacterium]
MLSLLLAVPSLAGAQRQRATVLSIGVGNTMRMRKNGRVITVRLACINAPEKAQQP